MSRFRNRNIRNKFQINFSTLPKTDAKNNNTITADSGIDVKSSRGFGEEIAYRKYEWSRFSSASTGSESDDFKGEDKGSSSSSLSWADDYEEQANNLVGDEYARMERVLQRLEPIPSHYDKDEYKLWIKTFPCLSLTGQSTSTPSRKHNEGLKTTNDDKTPASEKYRAEGNNIDKYLGELCSKSSSPNLGTNITLNPNTLNIQFKTFLQISPVTLPQNSSRTRSSALSRTSHWLQHMQDPLPPLLSNPPRRNKSVFTHHPERNEEFIILPPISANLSPFRSISAISGRRSAIHNKVFGFGSVLEESLEKKSAKTSGRIRNRVIKLN